jgi:hypothetical protein
LRSKSSLSTIKKEKKEMTTDFLEKKILSKDNLLRFDKSWTRTYFVIMNKKFKDPPVPSELKLVNLIPIIASYENWVEMKDNVHQKQII